MTLKEAKLAGIPTYEDGRPCKIHGKTIRRVQNSQCIQCAKEYGATYRKTEDKARRQRLERARYANIDTIERWLVFPLKSARIRAREKNLPFNLTKQHLSSIWTGMCPIFNTPLSWKVKHGVNPDNMATLDRIVPSKGYVEGNVVFLSNRANRIKNDASSRELFAIANWLATQELLLSI